MYFRRLVVEFKCKKAEVNDIAVRWFVLLFKLYYNNNGTMKTTIRALIIITITIAESGKEICRSRFEKKKKRKIIIKGT